MRALALALAICGGGLLLAGCNDGPAVASAQATSQGVVVLHVDVNAAEGGDGSGQAPFKDLRKAVDQGRTSPGRVKILVAPGVYELHEPLPIDYPLELKGSNEMAHDEGDVRQWPTGVITPGTETVLQPAPDFAWPESLASALVLVGADDGPVLSEVTIRNLTLDAGLAGAGTTTSWHNDLSIHRTQSYSVRDNLILGARNIGIQSLASSGTIRGNYITGVGCATCVGGGDDDSPARVEYVGNRAVDNEEGLFLAGRILLPGARKLVAEVVGNDLSNNARTPRFTWGVRIGISAPILPGSDTVDGVVEANLRDNRLVGNEIGFIVDAAFPFRDTPCASRRYTGSIDVTLSGNTLADSRLVPAIISFTRFTGSLNKLCGQGDWQYLRDATYTIKDPNGTISGYLIDHAEMNPFFTPACSPDDGEPLGNRLSYNGVNQPYGLTASPAARTCGAAISCASCCRLGDVNCTTACATDVCDAQVGGLNIYWYSRVLNCAFTAATNPDPATGCLAQCFPPSAGCLPCIQAKCFLPISQCFAQTCP